MQSKILLQIEEWKKRLIDLTRRNQLIYFNSTKKSNLEINHPAFEDLFSKLFNEKTFDVWLPPENNMLKYLRFGSKELDSIWNEYEKKKV